MVSYIPHLYKLFILEQRTTPIYHYPALAKPWQKYTRVTLKAATIFIFLIVLFYLQLVNFWYDPYKQPSSKGAPQRDLNRTFEIAGVAGGRKVFHYLADTIAHVLYLQDKGPSNTRRGGGDGAEGGAQARNNQQGTQQVGARQGGAGRGNRGGGEAQEEKKKKTPYSDDWIS